MIETGEICFSPDGRKLFRKTYLSDQKGLAPSSLWSDIEATGHNRNAKYEIAKIFHEKSTSELFKTPKPTLFIERILQISTDSGDLVLDSFAGSGTTGHAVVKMNAASSGLSTRRFILLEMESMVARETTAERIRRVAEGYTNAKGEKVDGLGGGFRFCELGEPLFDETGQIRSTVKFGELARHVYFSETREPLPRERVPNTPLLGICRGVAVYLLFNGILGDKRPAGGNVLTGRVLGALPVHEGPKVVYGEQTRLGEARLKEADVTFRQIPHEAKVR